MTKIGLFLMRVRNSIWELIFLLFIWKIQQLHIVGDKNYDLLLVVKGHSQAVVELLRMGELEL